MLNIKVYKICGFRKEKPDESMRRACWYFVTPFDFNFLLMYFDDKMWNVLGTEINRSVQEMKNPLNYEVLEEPPSWIKDTIDSKEGRKALEDNRGILPIFIEEPETVHIN
jgi:hypothetical protein